MAAFVGRPSRRRKPLPSGMVNEKGKSRFSAHTPARKRRVPRAKTARGMASLFGGFGRVRGWRLSYRFRSGLRRGFKAYGQGIDEEIDELPGGGGVGVFVGVVLGDGQTDEVFAAGGFGKRGVNVGERQAAFGGHIDCRKVGVRNDVCVEMDDELARSE